LDISQQTLQCLFRERLGRTPNQEVIRVRLQRSHELLCSTECSIKRIAFMVGFKNSRNFGSSFRRQTSLSPAAFRQDSARTSRMKVLSVVGLV
jgi:LacI family transcriptional regulator